MRNIVGVFLLAAVLVAGGCGSDDSGDGAAEPAVADRTLPEEKYVELADDICSDTARRVLAIRDDLRAAASREQAADLLERQLDAVRDMRERLAALGLPEGKREVAAELIADIEDAETHLEDAIEALRAGDEQRANESAQRYAQASMESARQVRDSGLDFEVCGSGV